MMANPAPWTDLGRTRRKGRPCRKKLHLDVEIKNPPARRVAKC